jgi:hypothetical protein
MEGASVSGGGGDRAPSGGDSGVDCHNFRFEATISSPQPTAVANLHVDEVLTVGIEQQGTNRMVAVRRSNGDLVGSLTDHLRELIRCIQEGVDYEAVVITIQGGAVRVRVQPA